MKIVNYNEPPRFDLPAMAMIGALLAFLAIAGGAAVIHFLPGPFWEAIL